MTNEQEAAWDAGAPSDGESSRDGLSNATMPLSPASSTDSLHQVMLRLALAVEQQNQMLWALVEQTATLVGIVAEGQIDDEDDGAQTYLDGTRMS